MALCPLRIGRKLWVRAGPSIASKSAKFLKIAVANSGGADSTCLLFLLKEYIKNEASSYKHHKLLSLTIDHDLQPTSAEMANHAATFAEKLGVKHITTKIPWGEGIYPPKPLNGKIELLARDARYALLFAAMRDARVSTLALAHHGDDQAETMLMRLGKGTSSLGMVGMRPRIRWGMGSEVEGMNWRGHIGLQMYKIRPLLDVGKVIFFLKKKLIPTEYVMSWTYFLFTQRIEFLPHAKQTNWNM